MHRTPHLSICAQKPLTSTPKMPYKFFFGNNLSWRPKAFRVRTVKSSYILIKLSLSIACLLLYNAVIFAQDPELVRHFDYDAKAPLDLKIISSQKRGDA